MPLVDATSGNAVIAHQTEKGSGLVTSSPFGKKSFLSIQEQVAQVTAWHASLSQREAALDAAEAARDQRQQDWEDNQIEAMRKRLAHNFRLTRNQTLEPNETGTAPRFWSSYPDSIEFEIVERVTSGQNPEDRTALAREFLQAINSDRKNFAIHFYIWRLKFNNFRSSINYLMYQHYRAFGHVTCAAIVKHESGIVPSGWWCEGLKAGEPAKLCKKVIGHGSNSHSHCHPYTGTNINDEGSILVALPAVVAGEVFGDNAWACFPNILASEQDNTTVGNKVYY